jgi:hypothetical protein
MWRLAALGWQSMGMKISYWRLNVVISSIFCFTNDVTKLSHTEDDIGTISSEIGLQRNILRTQTGGQAVKNSPWKSRRFRPVYMSVQFKYSSRSSQRALGAWS